MNESPSSTAGGLPGYCAVLPNYNHARYLPQALAALLSQSLPPRELIVVDDGSTDNSVEVIESMAARHPSIRLIRHEVNQGVVAALNTGLNAAISDYVCFPAADDQVYPDLGLRSMQILGRFPTAGFSFTDIAVVSGEAKEPEPMPRHLSNIPCYFSPDQLSDILARNFFLVPTNTAMFRRQAVIEAGGFLPSLRWSTDWFMTHVIAFRYGACYVPEVLGMYRVLASSYSNSNTAATSNQQAVLQKTLELLEDSKYADVANAFRRSALLPLPRWFALRWLLRTTQHRWFVTPRLIGKVAMTEVWLSIRSLMPASVARLLRRLLGNMSRQQ